ncbi:MAG: hypothetical protein PHN45_12670 [Methylococcales bacterium]|nr:hypothetical protein [Methylococcales bacterium]MDD5755587.1 hypothetical protein [Methylococcales bacterium]
MAISLTSKETFNPTSRLSVSFRVLLGLYLIIPLCLLLYGLDVAFWQGYLHDNLPTKPTHFLLFQILFGTPHILASTILLVSNGEYFQFYKRHLAWMTLAIAVIFGVGSLFIPYRVFYVAVAAWTVFHVLKQQHGVVRGFCQLPTWAYHTLLWLSVATGLLIYIGIFLHTSLDNDTLESLKNAAGILTSVLVIIALYCQRYISVKLGKTFLWANVFLVVSSFFLYAQSYYFFAILIPRLVHDATAYVFYVTHDFNKHSVTPKNTLYCWAKRYSISIFIVLPVLSFLIAFVLQAYGDVAVTWMVRELFGVEIRKAVTLGLLGYFALMHYYSEGLTWKFGSPYRQFISFSK